MIPYEPHLAECPGLSALPSPPIVSGPLDTDSDKSDVWLSFHTDNIAGAKYFFDDQKGPFFNASRIKMLQHE